jgi:Cu(I)/Ag(I) efflux system periplasmic protein CusF
MKLGINAMVLALLLAAGNLAVAQPSETMTSGEVRRVDKATARITLKHEDIKNLEMPAMTMVFRVSDPAMLDQVKVGDKVRFAAEDVKGNVTLMKLEPVR